MACYPKFEAFIGTNKLYIFSLDWWLIADFVKVDLISRQVLTAPNAAFKSDREVPNSILCSIQLVISLYFQFPTCKSAVKHHLMLDFQFGNTWNQQYYYDMYEHNDGKIMINIQQPYLTINK